MTVKSAPALSAGASTLAPEDSKVGTLDSSGLANFNGIEQANLFDLLRFIAATMVIFSHSFALLGLAKDPLAAAGGMPMGTLGVSLFFALSGFLVSRSWLLNPSTSVFIASRFLRIFPGLLFSTLVTVFAIGPLVTTEPLNKYFASAQTIDYLNNAILFPIRYNLPGVFATNPLSGAVNGSLWSLPVEVLMYATVMILGLTRILKARYLLLIFTIACAALEVFVFSKPQWAGKVELTVLVGPSVKMAMFFLCGACFYSFRGSIPRDWRIACVAALTWYLSFNNPFLTSVDYLTLPYVFFFVASLPLSGLRSFARPGDFSYGLYLFAFPVQQTLVYFWRPHLSVATLFSCAFVVTLLLSVISWHLVESPSLRLKSKVRRMLNSFGTPPDRAS